MGAFVSFSPSHSNSSQNSTQHDSFQSHINKYIGTYLHLSTIHVRIGLNKTQSVVYGTGMGIHFLFISNYQVCVKRKCLRRTSSSSLSLFFSVFLLFSFLKFGVELNEIFVLSSSAIS